MSSRHAVCGLLGLACLCGFSTDVGLSPMLETVSDEPGLEIGSTDSSFNAG
ncbi:MAG: hypothetical protein RL591_594 [Planctomycetota bacterium]